MKTIKVKLIRDIDRFPHFVAAAGLASIQGHDGRIRKTVRTVQSFERIPSLTGE